jgi:hypothetical protein
MFKSTAPGSLHHELVACACGGLQERRVRRIHFDFLSQPVDQLL